MYPADGRKLPDVWTKPGDLRDELQAALGPFPLFEFWGPRTSIRSSRWIADAACLVDRRFDPTLTLVYLPHLDYDLQRFGPDDPRAHQALAEVDAVAADLIGHFEGRGARVIVLSEYGITRVSQPVFINRALREAGLLAFREELGREVFDPGNSSAFAVADHQVAQVYLEDPGRRADVHDLLAHLDGVATVLDDEGKRAAGLDHPRAGDLVALARPDAWFAYPWWLEDDRAPDYARTVDIHRKPGYDPAELFIDPGLRFPRLRIAWTLLRKALGFRTLLEVVPLDPGLVRGSHGLAPSDPAHGPLVLTRQADLVPGGHIPATTIQGLILDHLDLPAPAVASYPTFT
jgi:predicted AlkP superfamily pyrophosphatase or phosphodiesterase